MIKFFIKNIDSFIVSTIFLILGFLPTVFDSRKAKNKDLSFENTNINNSNIRNTYNRNTYNRNYTEHNYNTNTVVINHSSTTTDDPWFVIILGILLIIPLILFYKHIGKILVYSITITVSCLLLSLLIYKTLLKTGNYMSISSNIFKISFRNIICWFLMLTNYITVFYKVNFSSTMEPFIDLVKTLNVPIDSEAITKIFNFLSDNPYESFTAIFIILSFLLSIFLISKLFLSYIWIISYIRASINSNSKFWTKIYRSLNKKESNPDIKYWVSSFIILFSFSTGVVAYILGFFTKMH